MHLHFVPIHVFRGTPQVSFFDAGVNGSNSADVVIHHKNAISPPDDGNFEQYYIHHHQIDHSLVIEGSTVLNQPTRDNAFDQTKGFSPVSLRSNKQLREAKQAHPVYWIWEEERIKRVKLDCKGFSKNTKKEAIAL